jgi:putative SOS response-associated peptidase YedK
VIFTRGRPLDEEDVTVCGRYARRSDKQKIAELFAIHGPVIADFGPNWNVAPQTFQPVVRLNRDTGEREIALMRWGLIPFWMLSSENLHFSSENLHFFLGWNILDL